MVCEGSQVFEIHHRWYSSVLCGLLLHLVLLPLGQSLGTFPAKRTRFGVVSFGKVVLNPCLTTLLFFCNGGLRQLFFSLVGHGPALTSGS